LMQTLREWCEGNCSGSYGTRIKVFRVLSTTIVGRTKFLGVSRELQMSRRAMV
jgi:hypothetical protein